MALKRVVIANNSFPPSARKLLKKRVNYDIVPYLDSDPEGLSEIKKRIKGAEAVIWNTRHKLTSEILDIAGPQLKAVSTISSGLDHVDLTALKSRKILLGNTPRVLDNAVADVAIGLLIAAARRFKEGVHHLESGEWKVGVNWMLGQDITGSTVGIIGFGGVGQAIVKRLKGFDVARFLYSGRSDKPEAKHLQAERVSLDQILKESDYVIVACPLTEDTKHLINKENLMKMKETSVLVNIARGGIVDQEALYDALKSNKIFAAGLDVVVPEPLPKDHPLVSLSNCYIIPHMGPATFETRHAMCKISANNILLALEGKPMESPVII